MLDLSQAIAKVHISDLRKLVINRILTEILEEKLVLKPAYSGKVAGKLGFACQSMYGRVGRAFVKFLYERQHMDATTPYLDMAGREWGLSPELENATRWLRFLVREAPPREVVPRHLQRKNIPIIWVDAREEPGVPNAVGGVIYLPEMDRKLAFSCVVPDTVQALFCKRKKQIFMLEVLGPLIAVCTFQRYLEGREYFVFVDNDAATAAIGKGVSRAADATRAAAWFWLFCAKFRMSPWLLRVCSAANPSDSVSRYVFKLARDLGWRMIPALVPEELLKALLGAPTSDEALEGALASLGISPISIAVPPEALDIAL
jgi:hypothetical protein